MFEKEVLLEQTRDFLKDNLTGVTRPNQSIRVMVDDRVPPTSGEEFIGIYGGSSVNVNNPTDITKRISHGLTIGITRRVIATPNEQTGEHIFTEKHIQHIKPSMLARAKQIIQLMLRSDGWALMELINAIVAVDGGCFLTPMGLISVDSQPETKDESHFDTDDNPSNRRYVGLYLGIEFGGAEYFSVSQPPSTVLAYLTDPVTGEILTDPLTGEYLTVGVA